MTPPLQTPTPATGGRRALVLALMALVFTLMLPAAGLALSLFAVVIAIRDLRLLNRERRGIGMATGAVVLSSLAFVLGIVTTGFQLYFSDELTAYNECRKGAGTVAAQQDCSEQLMRAFEQKMGVAWPQGVPAPA
ncbi:hypothetical protein [Microbispora bryophytorum]|uniref:DUF4190 domain-containing protein n=1 Tax=Microbispora bryophytorum subsp. camponoti TaxID=1677852 RepID=A0ABR8L377_9ACTN|nr:MULTISPECIES: hypothetical protein [Microbispora]MBD3136025.1 hypothetical protein [Microbispora bryophytorum]MBD3143965.1 hypothetical protein [Microbispora camponoti]TQS07787.1 hypothetical protein FLX07_08160 [Microbispora bryophytorum]